MEMQDRIDNYWSKRADEFSECRLQDLENSKGRIWKEIIREALPEKSGLRALDAGTGAGFYAFLLKEMGAKVTGIDYSRTMIDNAKRNSVNLGIENIEFFQMDTQNLIFKNESFDFIVSRNVTWTLPDPEKAYAEWCRVLAPGGVLLNFDANYGHAFKMADDSGRTYAETKYDCSASYEYPARSPEMIRERNDIAKSLYVCNLMRPQWDVEVLNKNGVKDIAIDMDIDRRIYADQNDKDRRYQNKGDHQISAQMFMIRAVK